MRFQEGVGIGKLQLSLDLGHEPGHDEGLSRLGRRQVVEGLAAVLNDGFLEILAITRRDRVGDQPFQAGAEMARSR